jgi:hypothetical protein
VIQVVDVARVPVDESRAVVWALDSPLPRQLFGGTDVEIAGWAVSNRGVATIEVWSDAHLLQRVRADEPRADVAARYPGRPHAARCGFRTAVSVTGWREVAISIRARAKAPSASPLEIAELRVRRVWREDAEPRDDPFVSLVVAGQESSPQLLATVASIPEQTYPHFEVLVMSGAADAVEPISGSPGTRTINLPGEGLLALWSTSVRRTVGDYLMFLEGGEQLKPDALEIALGAFRAHPECPLVLITTPAGSQAALFRRSVFDLVAFNGQENRDALYRLITERFPVAVTSALGVSHLVSG